MKVRFNISTCYGMQIVLGAIDFNQLSGIEKTGQFMEIIKIAEGCADVFLDC